MDEVSAEGGEWRVLLRPAQEYVRDLVQASEIDQSLRHVGGDGLFMLRTLIPGPSPRRRGVMLRTLTRASPRRRGVTATFHFLPPFFRLGDGGSCLIAWSKSLPAWSVC